MYARFAGFILSFFIQPLLSAEIICFPSFFQLLCCSSSLLLYSLLLPTFIYCIVSYGEWLYSTRRIKPTILGTTITPSTFHYILPHYRPSPPHTTHTRPVARRYSLLSSPPTTTTITMSAWKKKKTILPRYTTKRCYDACVTGPMMCVRTHSYNALVGCFRLPRMMASTKQQQQQ